MQRAIAALLILGLVAAACGSDDAGPKERRGTRGPITTTLPPPLDGTTLQVTRDFWHSGFYVELETVQVSTTETLLTHHTTHWLTIWGDFENLGTETAAFDPEMAIVAAGTPYANRRGDPPRILPRSSALGELTFQIPEDLNLESAMLVVGTREENQARVPLGSTGGAVRLEPKDVALNGGSSAELIDVRITGASLRYDLPNLYSQLAADARALSVRFDVTSRSTRNAKITAEDVTLVLPDGTSVAPAVAELGSIAGNEDGVTTEDRSVTFVIDRSTSGDFTLVVQLAEPFLTDDGPAEISIEFTL